MNYDVGALLQRIWANDAPAVIFLLAMIVGCTIGEIQWRQSKKRIDQVLKKYDTPEHRKEAARLEKKYGKHEPHTIMW